GGGWGGRGLGGGGGGPGGRGWLNRTDVVGEEGPPLQVVIGLVLVLAAASGAGGGPLDSPGAMKAPNCSACHGFAGQSPGETTPILAGLWPEYFKKAIADYASGKRPSTEMEPYAKQVIQFGVDDYAAYFGSLTREPAKIEAAGP